MIKCLITNNVLQAIGQAKNLKFLALEQLEHDPNLAFDPIFNLKNLQELCLFYCYTTDWFLRSLVRWCNLLSYVDLTGNLLTKLTYIFIR